ncbi:MAG: glycosyltransferase [Chthoniobacterales bacterium]
MKICDVTQFYSPLSGGVKRYLHEKIVYLERARPDCEHVLVVPGAKTEMHSSSLHTRTYEIASPLISRRTRYRALLNLRALEDVIQRERPDIIESADPYQLGWKSLHIGHSLRIPVIAFYHSHFAETHLRSSERFMGSRPAALCRTAARAYVRCFYNRFARTLVPSQALAELLAQWGVRNAVTCHLGVNTKIFCAEPHDRDTTRSALLIPDDAFLLLYVGRLAAEKNTRPLCTAFQQLARTNARFHLLVVGDGGERKTVRELQAKTRRVTWIQYCSDAAQLAQYYRAADLFVHPGTEETFGLVALESQACGTPVVGIRGSYMDENIQHNQTFWAAMNSAPDLAKAIEHAASLDLKRVGRAAAAKVAEEYAWSRVFERLFCLYRDVCTEYRETR